MHQLTELYRSLRRETPVLPAQIAWRQARKTLEVQRWARDTGFDRQDWDSISSYAHWREAGYSLKAAIAIDDCGWSMTGVDAIGRFTNRWVAGAIEHDRLNHRVLDWFVPACADNADWLYQRACGYGDDWVYITVNVTAMRAGIELGFGSLCGIESDSGDGYLTEVVFCLAGEAISDADQSLNALCDDRPACA